MLVLDRRPGETIMINHDIEITVLEVNGGKACIGIKAPELVVILRDELVNDKDSKI